MSLGIFLLMFVTPYRPSLFRLVVVSFQTRQHWLVHEVQTGLHNVYFIFSLHILLNQSFEVSSMQLRACILLLCGDLGP